MGNNIIDFLNLIWIKLCQLAAFLIQLFDTAVRSVPYAFSWLGNNKLDLGVWYCQAVRWIMPVLAILILAAIIKSMLRVNNPQETWGYLISDNLGKFPVTHWETLIGRGKTCDIIVEFVTISKVHCALIFDGIRSWKIHNLADGSDVSVNGENIEGHAEIESGDTVSIGGVDFTFETLSQKERTIEEKKRTIKSRTDISPIFSISMLTVFQMLAASSLVINRPEYSVQITVSFLILAAAMWIYILMNYSVGRKGLEPEILAFFLCTLCISVTACSSPGTLYKQLAAILLGMMLFLVLSWYLRDLKRVVKTRHLMAAFTCMLLAASLVFGKIQYGAQNWIYIMGMSFQPSELAKVCFIFAGAASLERLFKKRNLWGFMAMSFFCFGALALMSDFGTAAIFFVTFLIIAFMRSGDYATISIICCSAVAALGLIIKFKPYIASRFAVWGNAWENASGSGYQQVRTMSASASGGLIGVGSGDGWLHNVAAANTDLVFGMVCEEWGLIIALLSVVAIASMSIFAVRVVKSGRSSYYVIAACAATSMLVFQTMLNVFGSLDLFPLTGVTFPFVSCGGSSMLASWGILAFLKSADTRQGASFAVKKVKSSPKEKQFKRKKRENTEKYYPEDTFSQTDEVTGVYNRGDI
ncbi:MAG: FtsW/RodA/SpoVE family cell cycle protein [Bacillota bacterium]|nr:FtsW/RodA/SpoVE family cell cycle protein [Bacillota bacterium]